MDQLNQLPGRKTHRLNLDSQQQLQRQQEERQKQQQYERLKQEKRKRKEEKLKAKEEKERKAKEESQKKVQELKQEVEKYNTTAILFQPDSDSGVSNTLSSSGFTRLKRKIIFMFPNLDKRKNKQDSSSSEDDQSEDASESESEGSSDSEDDSDSEEELSQKKKHKKQRKKVQKSKKEQSDSEQGQQRKNKNKGIVKIQQISAKDKLVQQVAVRWNYALGQWPPKDYDYIGELKKRGYRLVQLSKFKFVDQIVDDLIKVYELDGYQGVYRCKTGLIDVRPKGQCPSLNYFYSKSEEQLSQLLKKALDKQIELLQHIQYKQHGDEQLLQDLKRRQRQLIK